MAVRPIVTYENPRLRKKSIKVKSIEPSVQVLIDDMIDTMRAANGIGLAAPQVGVLLRIVVCEWTEYPEETDEEDDEEAGEMHQTVLINPEILEKEGEWMAEEGCLSIPGYVGTVPRAEKVTVRGKTRGGKTIKFKADGVQAHILQHEIDHLDGILYIDYLDSLDDLRPSEPGSRRRRRRSGTSVDSEEPDAAAPNAFDPCCDPGAAPAGAVDAPASR